VLQERRYRPVGANKEIESDFRLVAATNRDLEKMTNKGSFREDLLFRLRAFNLPLPPLRSRREDIKALANHYIIRICERQGIGIKGVSPDFIEMLTRYSWPGNVRELINALETAISAASGEDMLFSMHIPDYIRIQIAKASLPDGQAKGIAATADFSEANPLPSFKSYRKEATERAEKEYLERLTALTDRKVQEACRISGLSRSRYYELIKRHGIDIS
jgi:two-component system NtrC family response regulator